MFSSMQTTTVIISNGWKAVYATAVLEGEFYLCKYVYVTLNFYCIILSSTNSYSDI